MGGKSIEVASKHLDLLLVANCTIDYQLLLTLMKIFKQWNLILPGKGAEALGSRIN